MSLDQPTQFVKHETLTRDAFLGGRLTLSQPKQGFRAGLDSVLLGTSVPRNSLHLLDLGAGVGTAALVALSSGLVKQATLLERDDQAVALAADNIAENGFADNARTAHADVTTAASRRAAGVLDNGYDVVIANPPYFSNGQGTAATGAYRSAARHMDDDAMALWAKAAASSCAANGTAIFIYPASGLIQLLSAFAPRFGRLEILPLSPRPGEDATRVLVRGVKGSRSPLRLLATRYLHGEQGNAFAPDFDAVFRGGGAFDW